MSIYYRDSGLTWKQYLQADSFVQDITGEIKRGGEGIKAVISDQTRGQGRRKNERSVKRRKPNAADRKKPRMSGKNKNCENIG